MEQTTKSVLIADDEKELIDYLARFIEKRGLKVFTAATGNEAVEVYKQNSPSCVLLDIHIPEMDGITVLKKIKEIDPKAAVYLVTGDDNPLIRQTTESLGAKGFLLKPINIKSILNIVESI